MTNTQKIIIMGGGSWGAALTHQLRKNPALDCHILVRSQQTAADLAAGLIRQLPKLPRLAGFKVTDDQRCLQTANYIYLALPVSAHDESFKIINAFAPAGIPVVLCAKGLVSDPNKGGLFLPEYARAHLTGRPLAVLTGPSFADEVMTNLPTALLATSDTTGVSAQIAAQFAASSLRLYQGSDMIGAAVGGAVKNVVAIAAGICAGQGFGDNARAGLVTRGLAETARLARQLGADKRTISGLAGMGDLVLSCSGPHSRNMAFGFALGSGKTVSASLAEGRFSAEKLRARAFYESIELPICFAVDDIVNSDADIHTSITALLSRQAGIE
jgi:glycerol-3-phosphate dehydrogenase (NAD(P)+)